VFEQKQTQKHYYHQNMRATFGPVVMCKGPWVILSMIVYAATPIGSAIHTRWKIVALDLAGTQLEEKTTSFMPLFILLMMA
jgi:flagellar biosynthesis protein FliQ